MELHLDGRQLTDRQLLHEVIARQLQFPDYYGENLDGLWDLLSSWNEPLQIVVEHSGALIGNLGSYGEAVLQLLQDAQEENSVIQVVYES